MMETAEVINRLKSLISDNKETIASLMNQTVGNIIKKYFPELTGFDSMKVYISVNSL